MLVNHSRYEDKFAVGDWVLLDASNLSIPGAHKFRYQFVGPFLVAAHIGKVTYHLDLKGWFTCLHSVFHVSLLCKFVASGDWMNPPEPIEVKDTQEYIVEHLLAYQHGHQGNWQFLV